MSTITADGNWRNEIKSLVCKARAAYYDMKTITNK